MDTKRQKIILGLLCVTLLMIGIKTFFHSQESSSSKNAPPKAEANNFSRPASPPGVFPLASAVPSEDMEKHREAMEKKRDEELEKYFSLKTREERNKYLDEIIAERKKRMAERQSAAKDDKTPSEFPPDGPPRGDKRPSAQDMKEHIESTSPEKRAKMIQMMTEMRAREKAAK